MCLSWRWLKSHCVGQVEVPEIVAHEAMNGRLPRLSFDVRRTCQDAFGVVPGSLLHPSLEFRLGGNRCEVHSSPGALLGGRRCARGPRKAPWGRAELECLEGIRSEPDRFAYRTARIAPGRKSRISRKEIRPVSKRLLAHYYHSMVLRLCLAVLAIAAAARLRPKSKSITPGFASCA